MDHDVVHASQQLTHYKMDYQINLTSMAMLLGNVEYER
jgi:hypothetical protein